MRHARQHRTDSFYNWRNHSLSLSFISLFVVCIAGQSFFGYRSYNSELAMHALPAIGYLDYLATGNFLDAAFTNWQAAILQLTCLVVFAAKFREKGAAHALAPGPRRKRKAEDKSWPWVYRHSFSLAFAALFVMSFLAHLFLGAKAHNEKLAMIHRQPSTTLAYGLSSAFWFSNMQTWEAEFAALALYIVLSIFLRQQGSPESKPMESSKQATGETNR